MRYFYSSLMLMGTLCASSPVLAQDSKVTMPTSPTRPSAKKEFDIFVPKTHELWQVRGNSPFTLMPSSSLSPSQNSGLSEDAQRKIVGAFLMGISVPMFVYGLKSMSGKAKWVAGRNLTARETGVALFGGALNAAQGATLLLTDGPEAKRRAHIQLNAEDYRDPMIPLLHQDALAARKSRQNKGMLIGAAGLATGIIVASLPVSDQKINRWWLVGAGLTTAAVGAGVGMYTYNSEPPEAGLLDDALKRQSMTQHMQDMKKD